MNSAVVPSVLYKYYPPDTGSKYLGNELMRFTQPADLNDARECIVDIQVEDEANFARRKVEGTIARHPDKWIALKNAKGIQFANAFKEQEIAKAGNLGEVRDFKKRCLSNLLKQVNNNVGVLSLTSEGDSTHMWREYAKESQGICIGFDTKHEFFSNLDKSRRPMNVFRDVRYDYIPTLAITPEITAASESDYDWFFAKDEEWGIENEWRMLKLLSGHDHKITVTREASTRVVQDYFRKLQLPCPDGLDVVHKYLFKIPHECIVSIRAGDLADQATIELVEKTKTKINPPQ